jgi:CubicO group peptidase (beta-lactamase class C family)
MSKPIFGILALQLVERGRLELDRPLADYGQELMLPDLPERRLVTARMVLSHRSGFPNWRPGGEEREGPIPLLFQPGSRFGYSGEGIFYLQRVLERITGQPLDRWATPNLFAPLGLKATGFAWTPALGNRLASGHRDDGTVLATSKYLHPNAAFSLYTTAEDYAHLLVEVLHAEQGSSALLSRTSAHEALAHQVRLDAREPVERPGAAGGTAVFWGLGWSLNATAQGDIAHHSGSNSTGFRCFSQFSPSRGTGLVILTNGTRGGDLWTRVVAAIGDF